MIPTSSIASALFVFLLLRQRRVRPRWRRDRAARPAGAGAETGLLAPRACAAVTATCASSTALSSFAVLRRRCLLSAGVSTASANRRCSRRCSASFPCRGGSPALRWPRHGRLATARSPGLTCLLPQPQALSFRLSCARGSGLMGRMLKLGAFSMITGGRRGCLPTRRWMTSASSALPSATTPCSPAASGSSCAIAWALAEQPRCWSWTSRPPASTSAPACACSNAYVTSPPGA